MSKLLVFSYKVQCKKDVVNESICLYALQGKLCSDVTTQGQLAYLGQIACFDEVNAVDL